jgi:hypothetical protein
VLVFELVLLPVEVALVLPFDRLQLAPLGVKLDVVLVDVTVLLCRALPCFSRPYAWPCCVRTLVTVVVLVVVVPAQLVVAPCSCC